MQAAHGTSPEDRAKARLGVVMFAIYAVVYLGFILINTVAPKLMGSLVFAGLTLAVVYGMGLIVFAILLGLIYSQAATRLENHQTGNSGEAGR